MAGQSFLRTRCAFVAFLSIATAILIVLGYYGSLSSGPHSYAYDAFKPVYSKLEHRNTSVYRFGNGRILVTDSKYQLSNLTALSTARLENLYENVVMELTAECSTTRRLGRREDGGWDICLVGRFVPEQPCFSFSFGVNNIWEFDDQVASEFKCQVVTFDPSMSQASHVRSERVLFVREGLHGSHGKLNAWSVDSYLGYLKRFKAENLVIDILKMDIEASEWPALKTAVLDGSLNNVKQLMLETHVDRLATAQQYLGYFAVLRSLHQLGFRLWHYNWNTYGNYQSLQQPGIVRTCCHELYYMNINFLAGSRPFRNPPGSKLDTSNTIRPASPFAKTAGFEQLETIRRADLKAMPEQQLEAVYFQIVEQQQIACPEAKRIGDSGDGGWDVCFTDPFDIRKSHPCVAFSFGINNVWNYDDQLADGYNCRVYMFDPSMTSVSDHQRKKTSWFYRIGLSANNTVESNGWKMRTLCTLFEERLARGETVDILKIDIEHWEWVSFEKAFQEGCLRRVKQLMFETHTDELVGRKSNYAHLIRVWLGLFDLGFRTWKWHKNPFSVFYKSGSGVQRACCYEHYMINTNLVAL